VQNKHELGFWLRVRAEQQIVDESCLHGAPRISTRHLLVRYCYGTSTNSRLCFQIRLGKLLASIGVYLAVGSVWNLLGREVLGGEVGIRP